MKAWSRAVTSFLVAVLAFAQAAAIIPTRGGPAATLITANSLELIPNFWAIGNRAEPDKNADQDSKLMKEIKEMGRDMCKDRPDNPRCKIFQEEMEEPTTTMASTSKPEPSTTTAAPTPAATTEALPPAPTTTVQDSPFGQIVRWGHDELSAVTAKLSHVLFFSR
mmetsp:Transcript_36682/g.55346  ORF Transcript_36682/g.55346 Transcript_36682/m.55346 type:complete len:165 (+) Transcript_36682:70-564(+)